MLIGNYSVLQKSPSRFLGGSTTSVEVNVRSGWSKSGQNRNKQIVDKANTSLPYYALPNGYYPSYTWMIPTKAGGISSINLANINITTSAIGAMGITTTGATTVNITANATGGLITSGAGSSSFSIIPTASILATVSTTGNTSFAITTNTPELGALGFVNANTTMVFSGSLTAYAKGFMTGSTIDSSILTVDAIAAGVLAASVTTPIYSDIRKVNSYNVTGNGQTGTEWGPL